MSGPDDIIAARAWFADDLRHVARLRSLAVVRAFAAVPREHFAGPGPWRLLSPWYLQSYWTTEDADPRHLYHDVLIAIDETRRLNNGQPSLWAFLYDQLGLAPGEHVVHVGIGTGYYSAILAEIVGGGGAITAVEIDAELAARARTNLASAWPQAHVVNADGFAYRPERPADVIIVNAGVTHLSLTWLDSLAEENGRLLRAVDGGAEVRRLSADYAPTRPRLSLRSASRQSRRDYRLHWRPRSGGRGTTGHSITKVALRADGSIAAASTGPT